MNRRQKIRLLNDNYRTTLAAAIYMSREFYDLPDDIKREALTRVRVYSAFAEDGEHDAGLIVLKGLPIAWRIEYRSLDFKGRSKDPAGPEQTMRILVVEIAN